MLNDLFATLSRGGHAKLLAWLSIGGDSLSEDLEPPSVNEPHQFPRIGIADWRRPDQNFALGLGNRLL